MLAKTEKNNEEMREYSKKHGYVGYFQTSAKKNTNIQEAVNFLVKQVGH